MPGYWTANSIMPTAGRQSVVSMPTFCSREESCGSNCSAAAYSARISPAPPPSCPTCWRGNVLSGCRAGSTAACWTCAGSSRRARSAGTPCSPRTRAASPMWPCRPTSPTPQEGRGCLRCCTSTVAGGAPARARGRAVHRLPLHHRRGAGRRDVSLRDRCGHLPHPLVDLDPRAVWAARLGHRRGCPRSCPIASGRSAVSPFKKYQMARGLRHRSSAGSSATR